MLLELVDETMGTFPHEIVLTYIRIALLCCEERVEVRPTISSVLELLSNNDNATLARIMKASSFGRSVVMTW